MDKKYLVSLSPYYIYCHNYWAIFRSDNFSYPLIRVIYPFPIYMFDKRPIKHINPFIGLLFEFWVQFLWV